MFAKRTVEFPTLGYWPGFPQVATAKVNAFSGPYQTLGRLRGCDNAGCMTSQDASGSGLGMLGLFDSGLDLSGWGLAEWGTVGVGAYLLVTSFLTTKRGVGRVRKFAAGRRARSKRRASLRRQLREA